MKQTIFALTCAGLLVGAGGVQAQDRAYPNFSSDNSRIVGNYGNVEDEDEFVGDYGDFDDPIVQTGAYVGDMDEVGVPAEVGDMDLASDPSSVMLDAVPMPTTMAPAASKDTYSNYESCAPATLYQAVCKPVAPKHWFRSEALLWFLEERETPPLLVTPAGTNAYGDPITSGLAPGFRFDFGHYFGEGNVGLGARVWGLIGEDDDYSISGGPGDFILRPFFDTTAFNGPQFGGFAISGVAGASGSFTAKSEFDMLATEVYGRLKFGETKDYRIDLIGGYSYFGIDDKLTLSSTTVQIPNQFDFQDIFDAENRFYGGQLGMETVINKGRWSLTSMTKVHLGNMNQRVRLDGFSQSALFPIPPGPVNIAAPNNGLYIQGQEGLYEKDVFTFVPEMNFRLGYSPREQVHLTVGYTFAYWSSVALAGNQINPVVDGISAATFDNVPGAQSVGYGIESDGLWMQGIDLGVTFTF